MGVHDERNAHPPGANTTDPSAHRVDLADPVARAEWLAGTCEQAADVVAAALDATASPGQRMLGRRAARELISDAESALRVRCASVGLDLAAPPIALRQRLGREAKARKPPAPEKGGRG